MKRIEFSVSFWGGETPGGDVKSYTVKGYAASDPCFGVHKTTDGDGIEDDTWTITHIRTGRAIWSKFDTRKEALEHADRIAPLLDWSQDEESLQQEIKSKEIKPAGILPTIF